MRRQDASTKDEVSRRIGLSVFRVFGGIAVLLQAGTLAWLVVDWNHGVLQTFVWGSIEMIHLMLIFPGLILYALMGLCGILILLAFLIVVFTLFIFGFTLALAMRAERRYPFLRRVLLVTSVAFLVTVAASLLHARLTHPM